MLRIDGVLIEPIGFAEPICPSCGIDLDRMPGRTRKCPDCCASIYVRTTPYDGKKRLFSDQMVPLLERQRHVMYELRAALNTCWDSPRLRAMAEDMSVGRRGEAWVDQQLLEAYLLRTGDDLLADWRDPPPRAEPPAGSIVDCRTHIMTEWDGKYLHPVDKRAAPSRPARKAEVAGEAFGKGLGRFVAVLAKSFMRGLRR